MTMPHLMNCAHDENGWCLDCVETLWNKTQIPPEMLTAAATGIVKLSRDFWTMPGGLITDGFVIADKSQQAAQAALEAAGVPALLARIAELERELAKQSQEGSE